MALRRDGPWVALCCAVAAGLAAFLLFAIQPLAAKAILPRFGGSPGVWSASLLFFQGLLLAGYALAHGLARAPRAASAAVPALVALAVLTLPVDASTAPSAEDAAPMRAVLGILLRAVGLPALVLATVSPTVQAWFARLLPQRSPYPLYALSNAGSLGALLAYPLLVEPRLHVVAQGRLWSWGFAALAVLYGGLALGVRRAPSRCDAPVQGEAGALFPPARAAWRHAAAWLALPALASALLVAVTNRVCRDLSVVPLLWVVPLALYLLSFVFAFAGDRWYSRPWTAAAAAALLGWMLLGPEIDGWLATRGSRLGLARPLEQPRIEASAWFLTLYAVAMLCHGELARRRPPARSLTAFYLASATGGVLGTALVALVCPLVFSDYFELPALAWGSFALAVALGAGEALRRGGPWRPAGATLVLLGVLAAAWMAKLELVDPWGGAAGRPDAARTFHGILRLQRSPAGESEPWLALYHGATLHGVQYRAPERRREPTAYYARRSGVGIALDSYAAGPPIRVGVVGLGVGTLVAYGRPGDVFRFYEIEPKVEKLARREFTFLADSAARVEVAIGDGRMLLEREPPQGFDLLVIDAFSDDAVPVHLLTREAFAVYLRHLAPDGILAFHVSSYALDLGRVVEGASRHHGLRAATVTDEEERAPGDAASDWILLTAGDRFARDPRLREAAERTEPSEGPVLWTDRASDLLSVLR